MTGRKLRSVLSVVLGLILSGCAAQRVVLPPAPPQPVIPRPAVSWADSVLGTMTLEEKAGQVLGILAFTNFQNVHGDEYGRLERLVRDKGIGSIVLSHGDVFEAAHLLNSLQNAARIPILVGADLERGLGMRIRRGTPFPDAMALGATRDTTLVAAVAGAIAREARAVGIHQNYSPVADVNINPRNPVINTRSFGDDVALVKQMVAAFVRGTERERVLATAKHFPGHGDTRVDSHLELPLVNLSRQRLDSVELAPFREAISAGVGSVMIAHLAVPAIDPDVSRPGTLSYNMVTRLLRWEMGFDGLIVSDAMEMAAVREGFTVAESTILALKGGIDMILLPTNVEAAIAAIVTSVKRGELREAVLDAAVSRILLTKQALGLSAGRTAPLELIPEVVGAPEHWSLARKAARSAVTLLRDNGVLLPLRRDEERKILSVILTDAENGRLTIHRPTSPSPCESVGAYLTQLLTRRLGRIESVALTPSSEETEFEQVLKKVRRADVLILPAYLEVKTSSGRIGIPERLQKFMSDAAKYQKPTAVVLFGDPYAADHFPGADALLCAYGDTEPLIEASAEALCGEIPLKGRLPISISPTLPFGSGIQRPQMRLHRESPFAAGFDPQRLRRLDEIVYAAIRDSAFPAAQLAVLKDGNLVWERSYGTYTYDAGSQEINGSSLFDLASLTKVVATTSAIMKLYEDGRFGLDDPVSRYLPQMDTPEKKGITIRQLLLHRGGLPPFRTFWQFCATAEIMMDSLFATPLVATPGDTTIYSDLGFITLGKLIEKVSGWPLSMYLKKEFFEPMGLTNTMYLPPSEIQQRAVPTELDTVWRKRLVQGTVHDENAAFLGGVSGHAGLFSTASDLAVFVQMLMNGGTYDGIRYLRDTTIFTFVRRPQPGGERHLGWDVKSVQGSTAGRFFSPSSYGHTGFTGTSIWIDPERNIAVIFLTNRVHPTRANRKIAEIRPVIHDAVISALR